MRLAPPRLTQRDSHNRPLLGAECKGGVESRGTPRGDVRGRERDETERQADCAQDPRVLQPDPKQQCPGYERADDGGEPAAELAQHQRVVTSVRQLRAGQALANPAPHDAGRHPIGEVLGASQHGHQRESPRGLTGLTAPGEERGELGVGEYGAEFVAERQVQVAAREGGARLSSDVGV